MTALRAGVLGWPVEHSKSPILHGFWLERYGIDGVYERVAAPPDVFEQTVRRLVAAGWRGANVTLPHKIAALSFSDESTEAARTIGAANTLVFGKGGAIRADNTDAHGFIASLRAAAPGWRFNRPALVLGAGGAARAVAYALIAESAAEIWIANRKRAKADALAARFGSPAAPVDWADRSIAAQGCGLIVNTTSLGMTGQPPLEMDLSGADLGAVAYDLVYTPLETEFLQKAARRGLQTVDGLGMLLHQAAPGFEAWFGVRPKVDAALRGVVLGR